MLFPIVGMTNHRDDVSRTSLSRTRSRSRSKSVSRSKLGSPPRKRAPVDTDGTSASVFGEEI